MLAVTIQGTQPRWKVFCIKTSDTLGYDLRKNTIVINVYFPADDDECTLGSDNCDANAACTNTAGSFTCACNSGYNGDGVTCTG